MDIVVSANNNEEVYVLPVVPPLEDLINSTYNNGTFDTMQLGEINLIGMKGLRTINIQSFFPTKEYPWIKKGASSNGWDYVNFFNKWADNRNPIRIIITSGTNTIINMACTVESFNYGIDKVGDIKYTLDLKEYRFVKAEKVS